MRERNMREFAKSNKLPSIRTNERTGQKKKRKTYAFGKDGLNILHAVDDGNENGRGTNGGRGKCGYRLEILWKMKVSERLSSKTVIFGTGFSIVIAGNETGWGTNGGRGTCRYRLQIL